MHSQTRRLVISFTLLSSFLLSSITSIAQDNLNDWSRLNSVTSGSKLSVKLKDGKTVDGKLSSVSDSLLTLSVKNAPMDLKREDVASVHLVKKGSTGKSTLIGLGIGTGIGAVVGIAGDASTKGGEFEKIDNVAAAGVTVIGAGAGALGGFLVGIGRSKRVLIYQAR